MSTNQYNPEIQALLAQAKKDWGDAKENRKHLVGYGIKELDLALYGIDVVNGEFILVIAPEKQRKTTFITNIVCNIMTAPVPKEKPLTIIDTLESGMQPSRYRDVLIANIASRRLMALGHRPDIVCPVCGTKQCKELQLSPEYLRYNTRTKQQDEAIDYAIAEMINWKLLIYGAGQEQGNSRDLEASYKRWNKDITDRNAKIIISDHIQQYSFFDNVTDYQKQLRATAAISDVVAKRNVVFFALSQVSLGSYKEARDGVGKLNAQGGKKAHAEANVIFSTRYNKSTPFVMSIDIEDSRKSGSFGIKQKLDPTSGTFMTNNLGGGKDGR